MLVEGYAAVFTVPDAAGDRIIPGAFSDWIASTGGILTLPIYWVHDHSPKVGGNPTAFPIGGTSLVAQREAGLYFRGELASFPKAAAAAELIRLGAANSSSIGYNVLSGGESVIKGGRELTRLWVGEITIAPTGRALHPLAFVRPAAAEDDGEAAVQGAAA